MNTLTDIFANKKRTDSRKSTTQVKVIDILIFIIIFILILSSILIIRHPIWISGEGEGEGGDWSACLSSTQTTESLEQHAVRVANVKLFSICAL